MPLEKISIPVAKMSASSVKATTTSMRVKPRERSVRNRNPPGEPIHIDEILALGDRDRDAPAGRAAVGIETDRAAPLALHLGLRGRELEFDALGKLVRLGFAGHGEFARV